jgi:ATP-dependent helicase/nuclease subunit A
VREALGVLHGWWRAATRDPADVLIASLVAELGLLPFAAAGELGALRAGALVYALDTVRASALAGDASVPGVIRALDSALDLTEAEAPLEPGRPGTVRLMNLHQAKGLEAQVVVLAEPNGTVDRDPELHIERPDQGKALGFARVVEAREGFGGSTVLAKPADWAAKAELEKRFEAAEEVRLLYVAVTRAREELVVARWPEKPTKSPWCPLDAWLEAHAERLELETVPPVPRASVDEGWADEAARATGVAEARLASLAKPTYEHVSVTDLAKGGDNGRAPGSPGERATSGAGAAGPASAGDSPPSSARSLPELPAGSPPRAPAASKPGDPHPGFRGFSWGTAVHGALAAAASNEERDDTLRATCRALLVEHGRPLDDHGEPVELVELVELVRAVRSSDVWARARRADQLLTEVPFALPVAEERSALEPPAPAEPVRSARPERRQLDLFGEGGADAAVGGAPGGRGLGGAGRVGAAGGATARDRPGAPAGDGARLAGQRPVGRGGAPPGDGGPERPDGEAPRRVLEGVVDLVFREPDGWVVVDYKTDLGTDPTFAARQEAYRRQVDLYADAWSRLTGERVKERILFFTAQRRVEAW